ncbi:D-alanyl-D-alanine carboxypeptidase DacB [Emticicia aquatica]|uniref:D-alanyl-D-alanine carboxypeptidase DacB n=1 Tax=Emticicia aquatica TaxID=1681835 RepID=A0ABN8EY44_9BACT|nr:D-alanyl-D-alanine carboxypeptidase [Emticicia aquatica]CAH0996650.1 D-alanyl-D-alanine carboxypeptidase DacB [Emticicia aquatica]
MRKFLVVVLFAFLGISCKTTQNIASRSPYAKMIDSSSVFSQSITGMALYDLGEQKMIFERNANRYFTPASNTKLFTFYASIKTLGDSIPALRYEIKSDSLIFWGTGDPTLFHPDLKNTKTFEFLKTYKNSKYFYFSDGNFTNEYFGEGWSWDDYNDYYSPELSPLPMYGNIVRIKVDNGQLKPQPSIFTNSFYKKEKGSYIKRTVADNQFLFPQSLLQKPDYQQDIPYKTSTALTQQLLIDTLRKNVSLLNIPVSANAKTIYSMASEDVYRVMMQESDNMLAEQLLLLCGATLKDSINSSFAIKSIIQNHLQDLPDAPKWVDGSGLSRYNLFTPRSIIKLLEKIHASIPEEKLFSILATGGKSGTIKNLYKTEEKPFIFAKSGSLGGVYNLSGYIITKKGKTLLFSLMNNNFTKPTSQIRREVEKILLQVRERE